MKRDEAGAREASRIAAAIGVIVAGYVLFLLGVDVNVLSLMGIAGAGAGLGLLVRGTPRTTPRPPTRPIWSVWKALPFVVAAGTLPAIGSLTHEASVQLCDPWTGADCTGYWAGVWAAFLVPLILPLLILVWKRGLTWPRCAALAIMLGLSIAVAVMLSAHLNLDRDCLCNDDIAEAPFLAVALGLAGAGAGLLTGWGGLGMQLFLHGGPRVMPVPTATPRVPARPDIGPPKGFATESP